MTARGVPSRIGFGVSGAHGTALVSRRMTIALIQDAFERGVRVFDTGPSYGAGEAERRLGQAIRHIGRDRLFISTKAGLTSFGLVGRRRDFTPQADEASLRASLARLGVEGVDRLFLHGAAASEWTPSLLARLRHLKAAGAFTQLGAAGRGRELDAAMATGDLAAVMAPAHPFLSDAENDRLAQADRAALELFAIETAGDGRSRIKLPRRPADLYTLAKALRSPAGRGRIGVEEGLKAALARPEVTCALMTTTQRAHLAANAALA